MSNPGGAKAEYDAKTGRLKQLAYDANGNGKIDSVAEMDGTRILRIRVDTNEDGVTDRWDYYDAERRLTRIGWSRTHDGVEDAWTYRDERGDVSRIDISTKRDGRIDRVEFYDRSVMVRSEEDTNSDGKIDKWETVAIEPGTAPTEQRYAITSTAFDTRGLGVPEKRFVYGPGGRVVRVDVPDAEGHFATAAPTTYPETPPASGQESSHGTALAARSGTRTADQRSSRGR